MLTRIQRIMVLALLDRAIDNQIDNYDEYIRLVRIEYQTELPILNNIKSCAA